MATFLTPTASPSQTLFSFSPVLPSSGIKSIKSSGPLALIKRNVFFEDVCCSKSKTFFTCNLKPYSSSAFRFTVRSQSTSSTLEDEKDHVFEGSVSLVLLAGGVGKRMGANMPKQYLPLMDKPIALHSFFMFSELDEIGEIIVVCDPSYRDIFQNAYLSSSMKEKNKELKFALPGKERQDSTYNGLMEIRPISHLVAIHDSARPLITPQHTKQVMLDAKKHGAAALGVPVKATIKQANVDGFVTQTLDRSVLWEMQTPQVIEPELLFKGFDHVKANNYEVTDDVSIIEFLKKKVFITPGCYTNLKVTTPEDLLLAEKLMSDR